MLLTFDIWDTVLRRNCHPDEVKINTAKYLKIKYKDLLVDDMNEVDLFRKRQDVERQIGERMVQDGYDDEYLIEDVLREWLSVVSKIELSNIECTSIADELYRVELEHEKAISYLDEQILEEFTKINIIDRLFISDFYTKNDFIKELLESKGFPHVKGYTSVERKLNKRSGKIFTDLHGELGISPEQHVHIGDNKVSDFENPNKLGIKGIHYYYNKEEQLRERHNIRFHERLGNSTVVLEQLNQKIINELASHSEVNPLYKIGVRYALLYITYIIQIIEFAIKKNISCVYFFTREGVFFKKIFDEIVSTLPAYMNAPKSALLEVSRVATFAASLREFSLHELMRLWNQYSIQSMNALYKSLDVNIAEYMSFFEKYKINVETEIVYPWQDERIINLFNDVEFVNRMTHEIQTKRNRLEHYLKQKGLENIDNQEILIVDIGWRGTIQDNLSYVLDNVTIYGYYLGLYEFINKQPENVQKLSFVDSHEMKNVKFVAPLEMLSNAPIGSIKGYERVGDKIVILQEDGVAEKLTHEQYIEHFQYGVLESIQPWMSIINTQAWCSDELKVYSKSLLIELLTAPPKELTEAFFSLSHNENFGVGKFVETKKRFPIKAAIKAMFSLQGKKDFVNQIESTAWPQGYLKFHQLDFLMKVYNEKVYFKK